MSRVLLTASALALALLYSAPLRAQQYGESSAATPVLELHSGFWINLHHFLYLEARLRKASAEPADREFQARQEYTSSPPAGDLTSAEQAAWSAALDAYARDWSERDLLHNGDMAIVNNRLSELENCADISDKGPLQCVPGLRADLVAALEEAAPVYRAHWWPQQNSENRAWMAAVTPLVRSMGSDLATRLAAIYQHPWPAGRLRVDVVWYAGPEGSYTLLDPVHITIASHDSRNQGLAAFEMIFHEGSHSLADGVNEAIARRCRELDKPIPRDLWHALLFYTTGELVRREVASSPELAATVPAAGYTPYAIRNGLYDHGWNDYDVALERFWQQYLDGTTDFDTAIDRVVGAL